MTEISESELEAQPDRKDEEKRKGPGRLLIFVVLLIALIGVGLSGYLLYLQEFQNPLSQINEQLLKMDEEITQQKASLSKQIADTELRLDTWKKQDEENISALRKELAVALNEEKNQAAPTDREWVLAEAEYLLRIANHRLLLERDSRGTLQLLRAADASLEELDDFSLHPVRAQLADEIMLMQRIGGVDTQGIFLQLEALKDDIHELPLRLPEFVNRSSEPPISSEQSDIWQQLWSRLQKAIEFRHYEKQGVRPLLSPDEAGYLELNMRLMFERAQLALLRHDDVLYHNSLDDILGWLEMYMNMADPVASQMETVVRQMEEVNIAQSLPDISGSLNTLMKLRRHAQVPAPEPSE